MTAPRSPWDRGEESSVMAPYRRLARQYRAEPGVPDLGGGVRGDRYPLPDPDPLTVPEREFRILPEYRPDPANPHLIPYRDRWGRSPRPLILAFLAGMSAGMVAGALLWRMRA